jgi:hypothetical protein
MNGFHYSADQSFIRMQGVKMMRYAKLLLCAVPLLVATACDSDGITDNGMPGPQALVRFVNAGVDMGTVDLSFVDKVENLPSLKGVNFRTHSGMYQPTFPGTRPVRVFPTSTDIDLTQTRLVDESVSLTANTRYTLVYAGRAADGAPAAEAKRLEVIADPAVPTPPANQIAIKVLHTAVGMGGVDVYVVSVDSLAAPTPADFATNNAGVVQNVTYLTQSAYINVPVAAAGKFYRFVVTANGSTTALFASTPDNAGAAASSPSAGPLPGYRISGSVLTAVVAPGTTPGTRQSVAANQVPSVFVMLDKVLNP